MTPGMLRHFWLLVETTQTEVLLALDDSSLVQWLVRQVRSTRSLNGDETIVLSNYIYSRLPLIRDLAQQHSL